DLDLEADQHCVQMAPASARTVRVTPTLAEEGELAYRFVKTDDCDYELIISDFHVPVPLGSDDLCPDIGPLEPQTIPVSVAGSEQGSLTYGFIRGDDGCGYTLVITDVTVPASAGGTGPQGPQGAPGAPGAQGPQGAQGAQGA